MPAWKYKVNSPKCDSGFSTCAAVRSPGLPGNHGAWTHQPLTNARYWLLISPLSSVSEQGPCVGKETQCVMMQSRGVNPTFGSGRLTSSQICQQLDMLLSNTQTLHTLSKLLPSRAAKTSSLPCWFIHDFKCLHHSLKTKQNKTKNLSQFKNKTSQGKFDYRTEPLFMFLILNSLNFSIGCPQTRVKPLQRSENQSLVDYGYSCMIPGQNMPSCKSFLCIVRAQKITIFLELGLRESPSAQVKVTGDTYWSVWKPT